MSISIYYFLAAEICVSAAILFWRYIDMSMICVNNLLFGYEGAFENVFDNVSFNMDTDWSLGLIGRNGRGKTTLLKILKGDFEYQGNVISKESFYYFPCDVENKAELTIEIIQSKCSKEDWEIIKELNLLSCDCEILYRPFDTLSMGEQTKCLLCAMFLTDNAFLLLDEPTNHLDSHSRKIVSDYLKRKSGFILVSHNRYLLNEVCDHIISINRNGIDVIAGNYDTWKDSFDKREQFEKSKNDKIKKDIDRLNLAAKRTSSWSDKTEKSKNKLSDGQFDKGYVGHKSAKMMSRAKSLEKRISNQKTEKEKLLSNTENSFSLKLAPEVYRTNILGYAKNLCLSFYHKTVFSNISFEICRGDRIALSGKNGCGKSSIIKILLKELRPTSGAFKINHDVKISYVAQSDDEIKGTLADYAKSNCIDYNLFLAILNKLDFKSELYSKRIETYSQGQKKKVMLAKSLCDKAHLYIWDEPLNYIDIISRVQLEEMILEYKPTMIFVEHDETFCRNIATKIINL